MIKQDGDGKGKEKKKKGKEVRRRDNNLLRSFPCRGHGQDLIFGMVAEGNRGKKKRKKGGGGKGLIRSDLSPVSTDFAAFGVWHSQKKGKGGGKKRACHFRLWIGTKKRGKRKEKEKKKSRDFLVELAKREEKGQKEKRKKKKERS